jgi:transposase
MTSAETREQARDAVKRFVTEYGPTYPEGRHDPSYS